MKKVFFLLKIIKIVIDISISKVKLCLKLIPIFDDNCKNAQIRTKKPKKI